TCPSCGTVNPSDRVFCQNCATELAPSSTEVVPPPPVRRSGLPAQAGPAIAIAAVGVVAVIALLFLAGFFGDGGATPSPTTSAQVSASASAESTATAMASSEASASASAAITPPPGPTGFIVFTSNAGDNPNIVVGSVDTGTITPIVERPGGDVQPAWSRDNSRIAWASADGIMIANADGTDPEGFTDQRNDRKPEWSPDDSTIVFTGNRDGDFELYSQPVGQDEAEQLTDNDGRDTDPSWSPATNRIAFVSDRDGTPDIWTMDPDGDGLAQLTGDEGDEDDPAWSPDGRRIAFSSTREGGTFFIYVMNVDGTGIERLATGSLVEHDPTWSPDGRFIAFARADEPSVIVIVEVETHTEVGTLSEAGSAAAFPAWQIP
ncbi:MAG TPA: hypothetical protein VFO05_03730, partial [Candidatus Limnocylindrales bacterium]|nr:hypothetical protein [Candidatus Limnocylindrales bacterium]